MGQASESKAKTTEKGQAVPSSIEKKTRPLLKKGSSGNEVLYLQQSLAKLDYNPGPIDGIFGAKTEHAVRSYQKVKGLLVDRIVGPNTWAVIESALAKLPPTHPLLKKGITSSEVVILQQSLFKLGFNPGAADGIFGDRTEQAVKSFQSAKGLTVDGNVGPLTRAALDKALTDQAKVLSTVFQAQKKYKKSLVSKLFRFLQRIN